MFHNKNMYSSRASNIQAREREITVRCYVHFNERVTFGIDLSESLI